MRPRRWAIRVVLSGETGENAWVRALDTSAITLGRSSKVELQLDDPEVSRRHAELVAEPSGDASEAWRITDLNSRNGTLVNGRAQTDAVLNNGDVVQIGPYVLTLGVLNASGEWGNPPHEPERLVSPTSNQAVTVLGDQSANLSRLTSIGRPKVDAHQLRAVQALGHDLLTLQAREGRLKRLCAFMVEPVMRGQHATVLRASADEPDGGWSKPTMVLDPVSCDGIDQDFYISRSLLNAVASTGEAVMATRSGLEIDGQSGGGAAIVELSITAQTQSASVIGCPLRAAGPNGGRGSASSRSPAPQTATDILYVVLPDQCGTGEWLALTALVVEQFELVERAWRAREAAEAQAKTQAMLQRAREVQLGLVPRSPKIEGLELALHFEPCFSVGGDYLDVVTMPDGRALLLVMDVCGKGLAAALTSASLHTFVHARALTTPSVVELMNALNRHLCATTSDLTFVTGIAVALDPATGQAECVNAGHPPAILVPGRSGGAITYSGHSENMPLGLVPEELVGHSFRLEPGAVLALYSDGLTEIVDDQRQWLGHEGLAGCLDEALGHAPSSGLEAVKNGLNRRLAAVQAGASPDDDMTFLLARRA